MLQVEHSVILSTFIKLPFVIKIFVSNFEWLFYTGFTVMRDCTGTVFLFFQIPGSPRLFTTVISVHRYSICWFYYTYTPMQSTVAHLVER